MKRKLLFSLVMLWLAGCSEADIFSGEDIRYDATALTLNHNTMDDMITGETRKLIVSFTPAEVFDPTLIWASDDPSIATVDELGNVIAQSLGQTVITVTSKAYPNINASCSITVTSTSGIRVTDYTSQSVISGSLLYFKNESHQYTYFIKVYNSFDESVDIFAESESTDIDNLITLVKKDINGEAGFEIITKQTDGKGKITLRSVSQPEISVVFPFEIVTPRVDKVNLNFNEEDENGLITHLKGEAITGTLTAGLSNTVTVSFVTDIEGVDKPENSTVTINSDNPSVIVAENLTYNPDRSVTFSIRSLPSATEGQKATITVVSQDLGDHSATFDITVKKPEVKQMLINQTMSRPVHAGDTIMLRTVTIPSDAYLTNVDWQSEDINVATVDVNAADSRLCVVTVVPTFSFNATNSTATEKIISATVGLVSVGCKLRPYQYVPLTGIMITDQWGNRLVGSAYDDTGKTAENSSYQEITAQYCSGGNGGASSAPFYNPDGDWGDAEPTMPDAKKCGSRQVYLTATVYPYTYPTIADPNTKFCWRASHANRFSIPATGNDDGTVTTTTGKSCEATTTKTGLYAFTDKNQIGKTILLWTGTGGGNDVVSMIRIYEYDPLTAEDAAIAKKLLYKTNIAVMETARQSATRYNWKMSIGGGKGRLFRPYRPETPGWMGSPNYVDVTPWPWTGPDVVPTRGPAIPEGFGPYTNNYKTLGMPTHNITNGNYDIL